MTSLLDIAPACQLVKIGEGEVECYGISAKGLVSLMTRFPDLRRMMTGVEVTTEALLALAPEAVAAVIAAGTGHVDEPDHEAAAERLSIDIQADLLEAILRITMPGGARPLADKLARLAGVVGDESGKGPATRSPSQ